MAEKDRDIEVVQVELSRMRQLREQHEQLWKQLVGMLRFRASHVTDDELNHSMEAFVRLLASRLAAGMEELRDWVLVMGDWVGTLSGELEEMNALNVALAADALMWEVDELLRRPLTLLHAKAAAMGGQGKLVEKREEDGTGTGVVASPRMNLPSHSHGQLADAIRAALHVEAKPERVKWVGVFFGWQQAQASPYFSSYTEFVRCMYSDFKDAGGIDCHDTYKDYFGDPYLTKTPAAKWTIEEWKDSVFCKGGPGLKRSKYNISHFEVIRRATLAFLSTLVH